MKLICVLSLLAVLLTAGCAKEEPQASTAPTATNAQPAPGMQGAQFHIPPRGGTGQTVGGK